jgi:hypothetical protein
MPKLNWIGRPTEDVLHRIKTHRRRIDESKDVKGGITKIWGKTLLLLLLGRDFIYFYFIKTIELFYFYK